MPPTAFSHYFLSWWFQAFWVVDIWIEAFSVIFSMGVLWVAGSHSLCCLHVAFTLWQRVTILGVALLAWYSLHPCICLLPAESSLLGFPSGSSAGQSLSDSRGPWAGIFSFLPAEVRWLQHRSRESHENGCAGSAPVGRFPAPRLGPRRLGLFPLRVARMHSPLFTSSLTWWRWGTNTNGLFFIYF